MSIEEKLAAELVGRGRSVEAIHAGHETLDGAGVRLTRLLSQPLQARLDPFLMLDAFASDKADDYIAGFPDHPHRGFETITYMIAGRMRHRDSAGHEGLLESGGVQWMTAGRGVIHSEIPEQEEGRMEGFQLWLNLPATHKMSAPWYRDFIAADLPHFGLSNGVCVTVIAGESHGVAGAVTRATTAPLLLDIRLPAGSTFTQRLPVSHNAFLVVYEGDVTVADKPVSARRLVILTNDSNADGVVLKATTESRALLIAGQPLAEPIVQYGPFVMNSKAEIEQAVNDYRQGQLA